MIKVTPFEDNSVAYQQWFTLMKEEGYCSASLFDPSEAFHFYSYSDEDTEGLDTGDFEKEYPYTISGSTFGCNPDGSFVQSLCLTIDGVEQSVNNTDLRDLLGPVFESIEFDPESDQFFAYAKTEEDAALLTGLLNHPVELGNLLESILTS